MARLLSTAIVLAVLIAPRAWAAPCVTACKDEIAACRAANCQTLTKKARRHCLRDCSKNLVRDCYADLSLCGATTARPHQPAAGGSSGGGSGGGMSGGGW